MEQPEGGARRLWVRLGAVPPLLLALISPQAFGQQPAPGASPARATAAGASRPGAANAAAAGGAAAETHVQPPTLVLRVGGGHSDNLLRTSSARRSGSYNMIGANFGLTRTRPRMNALLNGDLERRNYSVAGVDSEVYGTLDGSVELQAVPDRFSWLIGDNYGQARRDPFRIDSPVNRQHVNIASTGPRLNLPLGRRSALRVTSTVARRSYQQTSVFDGDTTASELEFLRAISDRADFGLTGSEHRAKYKSLPTRNSKIDDLYVSYSSRLASGSASLAVGTSRAELGGTTHSKPYLNLRWENDLGARSHLTLSASTRYIDAGSAFALATQANVDVQRLQDVFATADVYQRSVGGLAYTMSFVRTSVQLGMSALKNRYETDMSLDNRRRQVSFAISHELAVGFDGGITAYRAKRKFSTSAQQDTDESQQLWIKKRFAGRVSLQFSYEHDLRDSTAPGNGFRENIERLAFLVDMNPRAASSGVTRVPAAGP